MYYLRVHTEDGRDILQESSRGIVQRYTDHAGHTVQPPSGGSNVIGEVSPEWALQDDQPQQEVERQASHLTKLAFRMRFTGTEKGTIEIAQLDDPTASMEVRMHAALVRSSNADLAAAEYVDLANASTRAGVQALESFGLIAPGRAGEILDSPIEAEERY